jgi:hypothetical protein
VPARGRKRIDRRANQTGRQAAALGPSVDAAAVDAAAVDAAAVDAAAVGAAPAQTAPYL